MDKGNLNESANPKIIAQYFVAFTHGTSAMARGGKTLNELEPVMEAAINAICEQNGIS